MRHMESEPTTGDILNEIRSQKADTDRRFDSSDARIDGVLKEIRSQKADTDRRFDSTHARIDDVLEAINTFADQTEKRFDGIERRMTKIEATSVTKDYLDEKLGDLRGDFNLKLKTGLA